MLPNGTRDYDCTEGDVAAFEAAFFVLITVGLFTCIFCACFKGYEPVRYPRSAHGRALTMPLASTAARPPKATFFHFGLACCACATKRT